MVPYERNVYTQPPSLLAFRFLKRNR